MLMKIFSRITISLALVFMLFSTLIFCCAFQNEQASAIGHCDHDQSEQGHSRSNEPDHHQDPRSSHRCMCQQTFVVDLNKLSYVDLVSVQFLKIFLKHDVLYGQAVQVVLLNQASLLPQRSPPLLTSVSIPIFLKNSNLLL